MTNLETQLLVTLGLGSSGIRVGSDLRDSRHDVLLKEGLNLLEVVLVPLREPRSLYGSVVSQVFETGGFGLTAEYWR